MSAIVHAGEAAHAARRRRYSSKAAGLAAVLLALAATGCAAPVVTPIAGDPADPHVPVRPTAYRSTIGGYISQRPVEPGPWRRQNEQVTPGGRS